MAVKVPKMYKDMYIGDMTEDQANLIMSTRDAKSIPNLKNSIWNFPKEMVLRSLTEGRSIREIIHEEGIDHHQYQGQLRDYQTIGTAFMYLSPRSILGDYVGLGKTAEIAALFNYLKATKQMSRFLMAVENSAWSQTVAELMKFTGLYVVQLPSESAKLQKAINKIDWRKVDGIVIKHSALRSDTFYRWVSLNLGEDNLCSLFDTFVLDESSVIKNINTKTSRYTEGLCNICKRVHFLNATTFETNIMDIYQQADMMNPVLLPKKWRIEQEFCCFRSSSYWTKEGGKAKQNFRRELSSYKNQEIFKHRLRLVYFGRSKKDAGLDMPNQYKVYEVDPTNDQGLALAKGYRYMEVLNCPSLIPELGLQTNRKCVPKIDRLCSLVENEFADSRVMVYAFHIEAQSFIADELRKIGRKPVILNGKCKDDERWAAQNGFNDGTYDVIITNIKKSLNLYGGDVCILYSLLTTNASMNQVVGRIDRNVDDRIKTFVLLLYRGTDEYKLFTDVVRQRAKDSRDLTIDAKTAVDFFIEEMQKQEEE